MWPRLWARGVRRRALPLYRHGIAGVRPLSHGPSLFSVGPMATRSFSASPTSDEGFSDFQAVEEVASFDLASSDALPPVVEHEPLWRITEWALQTFDFVHESTGFTWVGVIVATTVFVRVCMLPIMIKARKNGGAMARISPHVKAMQGQIAKLRETGDEAGAQRVTKDMFAVYTQHGINPATMMLPPLLQMPVFISMFNGLHALPDRFPDVATEQFLWITNLSLGDPYYMLPLVSCGTMLAVIETGADTGQQMDENQKMMKNGLRAMCGVMFVATYQFPATVFIYWITSNSFSLLQARLLKLQIVAKLFGIVPALTPEEKQDLEAKAAALYGQAVAGGPATIQAPPKQRITYFEEAAVEKRTRRRKTRR